ncbi:MAG: hypothetical protein ACOYIC_09250 [Butyricicoccus sp.]|jgi:hypothetical protein
MKWDKVTTDKFGDIHFWNKNKIAFSVYYHCFENHSEYGSRGWIVGFSAKDGLTRRCGFCG